jgi:hypothetical protein
MRKRKRKKGEGRRKRKREVRRMRRQRTEQEALERDAMPAPLLSALLPSWLKMEGDVFK